MDESGVPLPQPYFLQQPRAKPGSLFIQKHIGTEGTLLYMDREK